MEGGPGLQVSQSRPEARLGLALRSARESRGVSLRALARTLHRSHSTLVEYERGHRLAPLDVVEAYEAELRLGAGTLAAVHEEARLELYGEDRAHLRTYVVRPAVDLPHQLPPDVAGFTGREAELNSLRAVVAEGATGTVVISAIAGTAGVGKTALAVHLAHELVPDFPDVQLYVNLHGYEPAQRLAPTQVLDRFLQALGVVPDFVPAALEEQAARYRGLMAGRRALVVLDNASSAEQVSPLLPASASCLVLVTSRNRLADFIAVAGAKVLMLDVLAPSEALELLARTAGSERVSAEPEKAAEVIRLCGCLPLAVRIAGARLATRPGMSLAALAERLSDQRARLRELSVGDVGVRASFTLSYQALHPEAARMFIRLGLIPGPDFARAVAAALTDVTPEEAERLLEALVDAHLVEMAAAPGRYRFHDLLRLYARDQAQTDETAKDRDDALRRMFRWYLDTADAAHRWLVPGRRRLPYERTRVWPEPVFATHAQAHAWFQAERASLVAASRQAAQSGLHSNAWQLADSLWMHISLQSSWADWHDAHLAGLAAAQEAGNQQAQAWMMISLAQLHGDLRQFDTAIDMTAQSLVLAREIGDVLTEVRALSALARPYLALGRFEDAIDYDQQALALCQRSEDRFREGLVLQHLGKAYRGLQRFQEAADCFHQALVIRRGLRDRWGEASSLRNLGRIHGDVGRFEEALDCSQHSLEIERASGHRWGEALSLEVLGHALLHVDGMEAARPYWEEALQIFTELGAPQAEEVRARLAENPEVLDSNT